MRLSSENGGWLSSCVAVCTGLVGWTERALYRAACELTHHGLATDSDGVLLL